MKKTYYFPDAGIYAVDIFGGDSPVCIDSAEVERLGKEWDMDLFEHMHEATDEEIAEYGVYDSDI